MTRESALVPLAFFIIAVLTHMLLLQADVVVLLVAFLIVCALFEIVWAGLPGERFSIVGFLVNCVCSIAGIVIVELFAVGVLT